ncbi:Hypothetical protein R9X50_00168600 [Acrodontium crateriforme]|uniref:Uncharacterized protein n=1 Tax=Acrodontium crateriforme TaxID=150365 RepID=A0AAQ3LZF5_9PEZI|nr:Hypothetical protein R9X50_00168600 [Acrodontium crateriforme]
MNNNNVVSTGRGGAGNIGHDATVYVDGDIVREGVVGESDRPQYSAGRGGAANIVPSPAMTPVTGGLGQPPPPTNSNGKGKELDGQPSTSAPGTPATAPHSGAGLGKPSELVVPETATRPVADGYENFHTGRGGQGNVYKEKYGGHSGPQKEHKAKEDKEHKEKESLLDKAKHAMGLSEKHE